MKEGHVYSCKVRKREGVLLELTVLRCCAFGERLLGRRQCPCAPQSPKTNIERAHCRNALPGSCNSGQGGSSPRRIHHTYSYSLLQTDHAHFL